MSHRRTLLVTLFVTFGLSCAAADDWPGWFGPQRDGVWHEQGVVRELGEAPKVVWRVPVKAGYSGPAVAQGRVFLTDRVVDTEEEVDPQRLSDLAGTERVICFDASNGDTIWTHEYECHYKISYPAGPRTTPLVDGEYVYTLGAMGDLFCLRTKDGSVVWSKNFMRDFELKRPPVWGWASHPVVEGDKLICVAGGEGSGVVALDKRTGEQIWSAINAQEMGYAAPVVVERKERKALIVWHDVAIQCLDLETGDRLWRIKFPENEPTRPCVAIGHPCVMGNMILVSNFYNGSMVIEMKEDLSDADVVWQSDGPLAEHDDSLNVVMGAPMGRDGVVFGLSGEGELRCLDIKTGEVKWRELAPTGKKKALFATTFIVPNGDRDFLYNDQGELIAAKLSADGYQEFGRMKLLEPTGFARGRDIVWSHPAFANKRIYARNDKELICVDLAKVE